MSTLTPPEETGLRAVVAEDETLIRLDLVEVLTGAGYRVVAEAGDGRDGIAAASEIAGERLAPVVMLTAFSQRELVERARTAGAMAYVVKPFTEADLVPAIELAVARFDELRSLEAEVRDLGDRLETRKIVDRAKALLQERMRLTEAESFRWIQKTSMDRRLTMREVAQAVIDQVG